MKLLLAPMYNTGDKRDGKGPDLRDQDEVLQMRLAMISGCLALLALTTWLNCDLEREAVFQASMQELWTNACAPGPVVLNHGHAVNGQPLVGPLVPALLVSGSPTAVTRLIPEVVVNSVNGMLRGWASANVRKESFKPAFAPPFHADEDPASPIVRKRLVGFRVTARSHLHPCLVFAGPSVLPAASMTQARALTTCGARAGGAFHVQALQKLRRMGHAITTALASDQGFPVSLLDRHKSNDGAQSEPISHGDAA